MTSASLRKKNRPIYPPISKWQIGLSWRQKVARREPERSAASAKRAETSHRGIPKGAALGAPLVTFSATGKSPGVEGRSALPMGVVGAQPPLGEERGAKSDDLLLEGRSPSSHRWVLGLPAPHNFSGYGAEPPCNIK